MIGLFGGTFNPIHNCHLRVAEDAIRALDLEQVWFLPTGSPSHKDPREIAPAEARLEMVRRAIQGHPRLEVCDVETRRPGASYTIDTLTELAGRYPARRFVFLVGLDAFRDIDSWREPEKLSGLADFGVFSRPGARFRDLRSLRISNDLAPAVLDDLDEGRIDQATFRIGSGRLHLLRFAPCPASARVVRERIRNGDIGAVRNLLPPSVLSYIMSLKLYHP